MGTPNKSLKTVILLALLTGLLLVVVYVIRKPPTSPVPAVEQSNEPVPQLYSFNGTVQSTSGTAYTVVLADQKTLKIVNVDANTEVVKRVSTKSGYDLAAGTLGSVKTGTQIVFYTPNKPDNSGAISATKIEIIK